MPKYTFPKRDDVINDIISMAAAGPIQTRKVIEVLAKKYATTKQRIAGFISFLVTSGRVCINRCYPCSTIF